MTIRTKTVCTFNLNLMKKLTCITPLAFEFKADEPSIMTARGHIVLKHRGNYPAGVGWGLMVGIRGPFPSLEALRASYGPTSQPPTTPVWINGAVSSGNIEPMALHYFAAPITASEEIEECGYYRAEVWGACHGSTAGPALNPTDSVVELLVEGTAPQNSVAWELAPGCFCAAQLIA